jgi:serine/threonine protein kinase
VIIVLDGGQLVLRDTGLAARDYVPGEGPAYYKAPEQQGGGKERPGPQTDVYQLAVVTYHLVSGHLPHPRAALPLRAQAREVPDRISDGLAAALAHDPGMRPSIRSLGDLFRTACDQLS